MNSSDIITIKKKSKVKDGRFLWSDLPFVKVQMFLFIILVVIGPIHIKQKLARSSKCSLSGKNELQCKNGDCIQTQVHLLFGIWVYAQSLQGI